VSGETETGSSATVDLTVVDKDIDGLQIRSQPKFTVHGTVDWEGPKPPDGSRQFSVMLRSEDRNQTAILSKIDADGSLRFVGVARADTAL
jgi:hypothetical protein